MALGNIGTYRIDSIERLLSDPTTGYRYASLPREHELQFRQIGTLAVDTLECQKPHRSADGSILSGQFAIPCHDRWLYARDPGLCLKMQFQIFYRLDDSIEWKPVTADHRFNVGLHPDFAMRKFSSLTPVYQSRDVNPVSHLNPMLYRSLCNFMASHVHPEHHSNFYNYDSKESFYAATASRKLDHFQHGSEAYRKMIWPLFESADKPVTYNVPLHTVPLFMQRFNQESQMLPLFSAEDSPLLLRFTTNENDNGVFYSLPKLGRRKYKAPEPADAKAEKYTTLEANVTTKKTAENTAAADVVTKRAALVTIQTRAADPEEGAAARAAMEEKSAHEALEKAVLEYEKAKLEHKDAIATFNAYARKLIYEETGYSEDHPAEATEDIGKKCRYKLCLTSIKLGYVYGSLTAGLIKDLSSPTLPYNFRFPNYLHTSYKMTPLSDNLKFTMEVPQLPNAALIFAASRNAFDPLVTQLAERTDRWLPHNIRKLEVFLNDQPMFGDHETSIVNPLHKICKKRNFQSFMNPVTGLNVVLDPSLTADELASANYIYPHIFVPFCNAFGARNLPIKLNGNTIVHESTLPSPCKIKFHLFFKLFRLVENIDVHVVFFYPDRLRFVGGGTRKKGVPGQWTTANKLELVHL